MQYTKGRRVERTPLPTCCFWPKVNGGIPMVVFDDWPTSGDAFPFLRATFRLQNPVCLQGIESRNVQKPDLMMYFDADDQVSPINEIAQSIEELLPSYELEKVAQDRKGPIRGVCVLEYKPTTSIIEGNNVIGLPPVGSQLISENQYRQFSVMQIRHVLEFQESPEGRAQYKAHDNPMHGLFGNINHYC